MRWLCISDLHGDADALSAVLASAERRGYDKLLVAGDLCFPGAQPLDVWRRLVQAGALVAQGVGDRAVCSIDPSSLSVESEYERERLARLAFVQSQLGDRVLAQLRALPYLVRVPLPLTAGPLQGRELVLVHGSPMDPTEPSTHEMPDEDMLSLVGDDAAAVIVCGGSHVPFDRIVTAGTAGNGLDTVRIIGVGSVGEALHAGAGRHADATFIELVGDGLSVQQFTVPLSAAA